MNAAPAMFLVPDPSPPVVVSGLTMPTLHDKYTAGGLCSFREVGIPLPAESHFRQAWVRHKRAWLERGFSLRNHNGKSMLQQWLAITPEGLKLTTIGIERLEAASQPQPQQQALNLIPAEIHLDLPELSAEIVAKLRGYQVDPARQLYRALSKGREEWGYPGAVDLSDMGTGKTYMAIAAALQTGKRIGVLCPSVGEAGWRKAFVHFGAESHFISTYEAVRGAFRPHIATMDPTGKFTWMHAEDMVLILDEAQALRKEETLTVRCCSAAIRQGIPIIVASATIAISPLEMRFAGRITGLHQGGDDWGRFLSAHGCVKSRSTWKWDMRSHHLQRIHSQLFPRRGCRVRKQDLGEECPETQIEVLPFDVPEGRKIEQEWKDTLEMIDRLQRQGMDQARARMAESQARMKMWQRCEMTLVPYIAARIRADLEEDKSVAVFMNFNESRIALSKLLSTNAGFYGGQPKARRQYWEKEFQANRVHVLVSNIGAGGASVSLHDERGERPRVSYIFPTDHVVQMEQATGRIDRVGGKSLSVQWIPCLKGAITEKMVARTRDKMLRISILNNGLEKAVSRF